MRGEGWRIHFSLESIGEDPAQSIRDKLTFHFDGTTHNACPSCIPPRSQNHREWLIDEGPRVSTVLTCSVSTLQAMGGTCVRAAHSSLASARCP